MEGGEDGEKRCRTKELGILATKPLEVDQGSSCRLRWEKFFTSEFLQVKVLRAGVERKNLEFLLRCRYDPLWPLKSCKTKMNKEDCPRIYAQQRT